MVGCFVVTVSHCHETSLPLLHQVQSSTEVARCDCFFGAEYRSPFKGLGANQALLDAVGLARALRGSMLCGGPKPLQVVGYDTSIHSVICQCRLGLDMLRA